MGKAKVKSHREIAQGIVSERALSIVEYTIEVAKEADGLCVWTQTINEEHTYDEMWEAAQWLAVLGSRLIMNAGRIAEVARQRPEGPGHSPRRASDRDDDAHENGAVRP